MRNHHDPYTTTCLIFTRNRSLSSVEDLERDSRVTGNPFQTAKDSVEVRSGVEFVENTISTHVLDLGPCPWGPRTSPAPKTQRGKVGKTHDRNGRSSTDWKAHRVRRCPVRKDLQI